MTLPPGVEGRPLAEGEGLGLAVASAAELVAVTVLEGLASCGPACWCASCVAAMGGRAEAERVRVVCEGLEVSGSVAEAGGRSGVGVL